MPPPRPYCHPGQAFIAQFGALQTEADVFRYVDFLRREAGLSDIPPIALSRIYSHFGIPTPVRAPLDEQQGILVDSSSGIILIKEDDPIARQRFTEGHELMELLFDAQAEALCHLPQWNEDRKERLCDRGAAELLMPAASFVPRLNQWGLSLKTIRNLAERYQTSLLATALRTIQHSTGDHALVMWHLDWKPSERTIGATKPRPAKKLRIWWRSQTPNWSGGFIPKDKSIAATSLIHQSHATGQPQQGTETIDLGWGSICCAIDAMPLQVGQKSCVLSLLHKSS